MSRNEQQFSLKDHLFNEEKVTKIAKEIKAVYPTFQDRAFQKAVLKTFPELELMERIHHIRTMLRTYLPESYRVAAGILLESLPPESDPSLSDGDYGDFIYAPYGYFVAEYGCTKSELSFSLAALRTLTTRFSVESPIRFFINAFPKETYTALMKWTKDDHYHVRRAASEGTRPFLPWAKKIEVDYENALPILDALYSDSTRFVTRSVANHVNDISKIDAHAAITLLQRWKKAGEQNEHELAYMTRHALRTLIKKGNKNALKLLGYDSGAFTVKNFKIHTPKVAIGETCVFSFDIISNSTKEQQLMIDYVLYFNKANGTRAPKTHKISKKVLKAHEALSVEKKHPLRIMTTRTLYPGTHEVELQINGELYGKQSFVLEV